MTLTSSLLPVRLWAPGLDCSSIMDALSAAGCSVLIGPPEPGDTMGLPLLVGYTDPLGLCQQQSPDGAVAAVRALLSSLPQTLACLRHSRLVNFGCVSIPSLVAWCTDPCSPNLQVCPLLFQEPDLLEAQLALHALERFPDLSAVYLALESHPLAAAMDQRPIDGNFRERYQTACRWEALLDARDQASSLHGEIQELVDRLEPFESHRMECLSLRQQVHHLASRLERTDFLEQRCSDLELSLHAQHYDLEALSLRLSLLEHLVHAASSASLKVQSRLAQAFIA
jgi:hypothetical protein